MAMIGRIVLAELTRLDYFLMRFEIPIRRFVLPASSEECSSSMDALTELVYALCERAQEDHGRRMGVV
jgi:hypothetical protein